MRHLRKLRKMKDIEHEDERQHQELLVAMYNYVEPEQEKGGTQDS